MLPCCLNWPASLVVLVSTRGTRLISAANSHLSGCSTETLLCSILDNNENTPHHSSTMKRHTSRRLWKNYRHHCELPSFCSHVEQQQKPEKGKIWCEFMGKRGEAREWETAKSPSLPGHHMGRMVGESWFGDFPVSPSDGRNTGQEREAASWGWREGELQWVKGREPHVNKGRTNHGEKWQEDGDARHWDLPDIWKGNFSHI